MSAEFISRIIGMIVGIVGGAFLGDYVAVQLGASRYQYAALFLLVGALVGLVLTPYITVWPFVTLRKRIRQAPAQQILAVVLGLIVGLIIAGLMALGFIGFTGVL